MIKNRDIIGSAVLRLTAWYLLLVMVLSVGFSIYLYQVYTDEFGHSLKRGTVYFVPPPPMLIPDPEQFRMAQLRDSQDRLRNNLLFFNLIVLMLGGAASYFLAKRTLQPIEDSMEVQNRFIADASHELRTPLTAMRSEIEVGLRNPKLNLSEAKLVLVSNLEEVIRLNDLSNNLLVLAHQNQIAVKDRINLADAIHEVVNKMQNVAKEKSVTLQNRVTKKTWITFNKQNLAEVVTILLDNAVKYSPPKTTVIISVSSKADKAYLSIKDEGSGIRASDIPHLFDRFYRADRSRTHQKVPSYGLGLAIAKQITEANDSQISVESTPEKGSIFIVAIPLNHFKDSSNSSK